MLEIDNIKKSYYSPSGRIDVLKGVTLSLPDKGLIFIVGKSGGGKSTLLNIICGIEKADGGEVLFDGKPISPGDAGVIFQQKNLFKELSVRENILFSGGSEERLKSVSARLEIDDILSKNVNEISGGQAQRAAIARALMSDCLFLVADEPTGNLDENTGDGVFKLLKELSANRLIIVVTHDLENAEKYGNGMFELDEGIVTAKKSLLNEKNAVPASAPKRENIKYPYLNKVGRQMIFAKKGKTAVSFVISVLLFLLMAAALLLNGADHNKIYSDFLSVNADYKYILLNENGNGEYIKKNSKSLSFSCVLAAESEDSLFNDFPFAKTENALSLSSDGFYYIEDYSSSNPLSVGAEILFSDGSQEIIYNSVIKDGEEIQITDNIDMGEYIGCYFKPYSVYYRYYGDYSAYFDGLKVDANKKAELLNKIKEETSAIKYCGGIKIPYEYLFEIFPQIVVSENNAYAGEDITSYFVNLNSVASYEELLENFGYGGIVYTETEILNNPDYQISPVVDNLKTIGKFITVAACLFAVVELIFLSRLIYVGIKQNDFNTALLRTFGISDGKIFFAYVMGIIAFVVLSCLAVFALFSPLSAILNAAFYTEFFGSAITFFSLSPSLFLCVFAAEVVLSAVPIAAAFAHIKKMKTADGLRSDN